MLWLAQSNPTGVLPAYRKRTRTLVASNSQMSKIPVLFTCVASAAFALPALAFAQYGGQGLGSALGSDPLSHQGQVRPGVEANAAVAPMSSMLFLRSTEQIAKLHLVAELGRIGDAQGALPIMHFLAEPEDERGRGTAVFALGEIGNEQSDATPQKGRDGRSECDGTAAGARSAAQDRRRPSFRASKTAGFAARPACRGSDRSELAKLRALDQELQNQER